MCCQKKWNSNIFLHRNLFQRKKAKKEPKGQTNFLRPTNLKRGQIFLIWPKKGQSGNLDFKLFLLLVGRRYILSISPCQPLRIYPHAHQANNVISACLILWWLLSCGFCQWCHLARSFHNQNFQVYHQILIDDINVKSFIPRVILAQRHENMFEIKQTSKCTTVNWQKILSFTCINTKRMSNKTRCHVPVKQMFRSWITCAAEKFSLVQDNDFSNSTPHRVECRTGVNHLSRSLETWKLLKIILSKLKFIKYQNQRYHTRLCLNINLAMCNI